ncbi:hypothetical protein [Nonomuraea sp. NPDC048901]|uniref:hypothetical protein n=1 Tax=Nonomuraea sp. NPDC048901 TaxID=3155627 RepID=UPI0033ED0DBF
MELRFTIPDDHNATSGDDGGGVVLPFDRDQLPDAPSSEDSPPRSLALAVRTAGRHQGIRLRVGFRAAVVGDGLLGMRPRPVADLIRQFWFAPKPYIRDALILRIPYAIYGAPVIAASAVLHLLLLIVSYPSLLAATGLLAMFLSLFV